MELKCECGGALEEVILEEFDFSAFAGLPVLLRNTPGLRCSKCGKETIPGDVVNEVLHLLAIEITKQPWRLRPQLSRFLRKHLRLSQKELAERMGIVRETVAKWECGESSISSQHDFILRAIAIAHLMKVAPNRPEPSDITDAISSVRSGPVEAEMAMPPPFIIDDFLGRARAAESQRHR